MAKKDVHSIVSGAGWIASFTGLLVEELKELGVSAEDIHKLGKPTKEGRALVRVCAEKIAESVKGVQSEFPVTIDYDQSLTDMIAAGHYDRSNSDITIEHFLIKGKGKAERRLQLIHFGKAISTDSVLDELEKQGLRPAEIEELLAFGVAYPNKQREFPIICLGSVWADPGGGRSVPCLGRSGSGRGLFLDWLGGGWLGGCRFLVVRK